MQRSIATIYILKKKKKKERGQLSILHRCNICLFLSTLTLSIFFFRVRLIRAKMYRACAYKRISIDVSLNTTNDRTRYDTIK